MGEFAKQFLEQRSRWRQSQRSVQQYEEDNMCIPAKAVNPGQVSDFHEVKSKAKKCKKSMPVCWGSASLHPQIELMSENATLSTACKKCCEPSNPPQHVKTLFTFFL